MAITDNTKKKLPDEEGLGAGLGIPGGLVAPSGAGKTKVHSVVQPGLARPQSEPMTAFQAGQKAGAAFDRGKAQAKELATGAYDFLTKPLQVAGEFGRGFFSSDDTPDISPISPANAAERQAPAAPQSAASTPAANPPAVPVAGPAANMAPPVAASPVVGQFNGRDITRAAADAAAARLPTTSGPVVAGPNGSFAFAPPGTLQATAQAVPPTTVTPLVVPELRAPGSNTSRVSAAERERADLVKSLDSQIDRLTFGPGALNSRGERQLYADLVGQRANLTAQAGDLAGRAAAGDQDAAARLSIATQGEQGALNRAALSERGANARTAAQQAGETLRAGLQRPEYVTDSEGNVLLARGTTAQPLTDAGGKPVRAATRPQGQITPEVQLDALVKQLQADSELAATGDQEAMARAADMRQRIAKLTGMAAPQTAVNPKTRQRIRLNPATNQWEPIQ